MKTLIYTDKSNFKQLISQIDKIEGFHVDEIKSDCIVVDCADVDVTNQAKLEVIIKQLELPGVISVKPIAIKKLDRGIVSKEAIQREDTVISIKQEKYNIFRKTN